MDLTWGPPWCKFLPGKHYVMKICDQNSHLDKTLDNVVLLIWRNIFVIIRKGNYCTWRNRRISNSWIATGICLSHTCISWAWIMYYEWERRDAKMAGLASSHWNFFYELHCATGKRINRNMGHFCICSLKMRKSQRYI